MGLLNNKVVIITGAASLNGIGRCTAKTFADNGAKVVIVDLNLDAAEAAAAGLGEDHLGLAADVTSKKDCERVAQDTLKKFGRIDALVNNAGITQPVKTLEISGIDYERITDVSLRGTLYMSQAVLPNMMENNSGSIVCMSSVSAQRGGGIFGGPHYSAAKGGVLGLSRAMAREFGTNNIRVNSIAPGLIQTDITAGKLDDHMRDEILKGIPLGRLGNAVDVANACLYLVSDLSSYLTGVTLDVNGGMLIH